MWTRAYRPCATGSALALSSPWRIEHAPDSRRAAGDRADALIELCDIAGCHLVLTTGGTGPAPRDVTPEATLAVAHKVLPGFGEQMRQISLNFVPTRSCRARPASSAAGR
jgi:molybdopterin adenylyltransferase